ncbi:MAG TPA: DUF6094 domain-containing protein [Ktedonobacteraceae bacterium]|jgi:superfamily II DNA or RNA helicase|nr:DUF6094 domain-containing protein [Ktedonobacteraceae bacterium]
MPRTESQVKGLYYPTPEPVISMIAQYLSCRYPSGDAQEMRFLDPCAGKGRALELLAKEYREHIQQMWHYCHTFPQVLTHGIEPNISRVKAARKVLDDVLHASFFQSLISSGDSLDGGFQLAFVNPPYDWDKESGGERLELTFLRRTTKKLCPGGVLIWIVPQWIVEKGASYLSQWYTDIKVLRFPDTPFATPEMVENKEKPVPMFEMFDQVVVIAQKGFGQRSDRSTEKVLIELGTTDNPHDDISPIEAVTSRSDGYGQYSIPIARSAIKYWSPSRFDPEEAAALLAVPQGASLPANGVYSKLQYKALHWPSDQDRGNASGRPVQPLKDGHRAIMAAAGIVNGAYLVGKDGRTVVVKGFSRKRKVTKVSEDEENIITEKRDSFESSLWCIDMTEGDTLGQLIRIETGPMVGMLSIPHETMSLRSFLDNFGGALTEKLLESNPPLYHSPSQVPWANAAFSRMLRQPLGRQKGFILAIVNAMVGGKDHAPMNRVGEIAEMATGKTYLSLSTLFLGDMDLNGCADMLPSTAKKIELSPAVVMVPEIIAYKWKREAEDTIPNVHAIVVQRIDTPEKSRELRQFDPFWRGEKLSAVGCIERVIKRIDYELQDWRQQYDEAKLHGRPLPQKPCHLVIIPNGTAKLSMAWTLAYRLSPMRTLDANGKVAVQHDEETKLPRLTPCCPSCFAPVKDQARIDRLMKSNPDYKRKKDQIARKKRNGKALSSIEEEMDEDEGAYVTEQELWISAKKHKKRWCGSCGGPLWQYTTGKDFEPKSVLRSGDAVVALPLPDSLGSLPKTVKDTSFRRFSVADYIRKFHSGFFKLLISDEIHQGKEGTALDFARRSLMGACESYLGLTGTLCNGYASSLFPFAWSINPDVRQQFSYDGMREWVDRYGARKTVIKEKKDDLDSGGDGAISKKKSSGRGEEHEMAAFSPNGLPPLFERSAFLELKDVAPYLPPYSEEVDIIPMSGPLEEAYKSFESTITAELAAMLVLGDKRALGSWFQCLRRYPNMPFEETVCSVKKTGYILGTARKLDESEIYPKEQRIIDIIQGELEQDRKVIIYCENTGEHDIQPRYKSLIETHVRPRNGNIPQVAILRSGNTLGREAVLKKHVENGCNVLICNSALVQVGLDLIDFHTIICSEVPTSTSQMRQSFRRIHRPKQTKHTKVIILVYPTMEQRLLLLMSRKMETAFMVEGQLPGEGLVSFGVDEGDSDSSFSIALARQVKEALDSGKNNTADLMAEAEELQRQFKASEEAALARNEYITADADPEQEDMEIPLAGDITTEPLKGSVEPMIIIPVALTQDPWAALRAKRDALKRTRKAKKVAAAVQTNLW